MSHTELRSTLEAFAKDNTYIRVELTSGENARGRITHVGDFGVMLEIVEDFHFDGFGTINFECIEAVHHDEDEKFIASILEKESLNSKEKYHGDFSSAQTFLTGLIGKCIMLEDSEYELHFVRLDELTDGNAMVTPFSSTGQFESPFSQIIEDIYTVRFENEYLKMYQKYAK